MGYENISNMRNKEVISDETDLASAVIWHRWETVHRLIEKHEKNRSKQRNLKQLALHTICIENAIPPDDIWLLLRDVVNVCDLYDDTPLMYAARIGNSHSILNLVQFGADVTAVNKKFRHSYSALSVALTEGKSPLTSDAYAALTHPATMNLKDRNGNTPLHFAVDRGYHAAITKLVEAGADLAARNPSGLIPLEKGLLTKFAVNNPRLTFQLIPQNMEPHIIINYLLSLHRHQPPQRNLLHIPGLISALLLSTKTQDYFSMHDLQIDLSALRWKPLNRNLSLWKFTNICNDDHEKVIPAQMDSLLLSALSILIRKCLRGVTSSKCAARLIQKRGRYEHAGRSDERIARFEDFVKEAEKIDAAFDCQFSLQDYCLFTIRKCIQYPKFENARMLPLPKKLIELVSCQDVEKEICEIMDLNQ